MIITKKKLNLIIEQSFDSSIENLLLEQENDPNEWVGLTYKEVAQKLKAAGATTLRGAWWKQFKRNDPVRIKYRSWYKNRRKARKPQKKTGGAQGQKTQAAQKTDKKPPSLKVKKGVDKYSMLMDPRMFDKANDVNAYKLYMAASSNRKKYGYPAPVPTHEAIFMNPEHPYFGLNSGEVAYIRGNKKSGVPPTRKYETGFVQVSDRKKSQAMLTGWLTKMSKQSVPKDAVLSRQKVVQKHKAAQADVKAEKSSQVDPYFADHIKSLEKKGIKWQLSQDGTALYAYQDQWNPDQASLVGEKPST